jgi:hypothetical protein
MKQHTCPTCGCPVRVSGRTTKHYEPILPEEVRELILESNLVEIFLPDKTRERFNKATVAVERILEGEK